MFTAVFGAGMAMAPADVCKTPPFAIPAPFPNLAQNAVAIPGYFTVLINGMPELNILSMHAITNGDEAGVMGGVVSQTIIGPARAVMGSMVVFIGGMPVQRTTDPTLQNLANAPGFNTVPGQFLRIALR